MEKSKQLQRIWPSRIQGVVLFILGLIIYQWLTLRLLADTSASTNPSPIVIQQQSLRQSEPVKPPKIPHIIHQSWKNMNTIPMRFTPWMRSWLDKNPDWTYMFWTDEDCMGVFEKHYPKYLNVAKNVLPISLADMARYAMLHRYGGLYIDSDVECKQSLDKLHQDYELYIGVEPKPHVVLLEEAKDTHLCNAVMASAPGHRFWIDVLDHIKEKFERNESLTTPISLTGPRMIKSVYHESYTNDASFTVLPEEYFYPEIAYWNIGNMENICNNRHDAEAKEACRQLREYPTGRFTKNTYGTHHWQCTWCLGDRAKEYTTLQKIFDGRTVTRPYFS